MAGPGGISPKLVLRIAVLAVMAAFCLASAAAAPSAAEGVRGEAFALLDPGDGADVAARFLALPEIDGIVIRTGWAALEPQPGSYAWQSLDALLMAAQRAGKKATLHILASAYASPPPWLAAAGMQSYTPALPPFLAAQRPAQARDGQRQDPVPWDHVLLRRWSDFLAALAKHLAAAQFGATVENLSVGVPVPEMSLVGCRNGQLSETPPIAYRRDLYLGAWKYSIYAMRQAFPFARKLVSAPVGEICFGDHDGAAFYGALADYMAALNAAAAGDGKNGRFVVFAADLDGDGSQRLDGLGSARRNLPVAFQYVGAAAANDRHRFRGDFPSSVCTAYRRYGALYFELYKQDLVSGDKGFAGAIRRIHALDGCPQ